MGVSNCRHKLVNRCFSITEISKAFSYDRADECKFLLAVQHWHDHMRESNCMSKLYQPSCR